jgi:hypothetical protein
MFAGTVGSRGQLGTIGDWWFDKLLSTLLLPTAYMFDRLPLVAEIFTGSIRSTNEPLRPFDASFPRTVGSSVRRPFRLWRLAVSKEVFGTLVPPLPGITDSVQLCPWSAPANRLRLPVGVAHHCSSGKDPR